MFNIYQFIKNKKPGLAQKPNQINNFKQYYLEVGGKRLFFQCLGSVWVLKAS